MEQDVVYSQPVVIDNGSGILKAGFAGADKPQLVFSNYVGKTKHTKCMVGALEGEFFVGDQADLQKGLLTIEYPMQHGIVTNWGYMDKIWNYTYKSLNVPPEEHPVLLTEAPLNPIKNREKAAEYFFESYNVPALFISLQAVLSLYASGETTGLTLDIGDGVSHVVPIVKGFSVQMGIMRMNIGGRDITDYLQLLMMKAGYDFHTSAEREIVREIKENLCYDALDPEVEEKLAKGIEAREKMKMKFKLPDGNIIELGPERFRAPEILFQPSLIGEEYLGIHQMMVHSITKTDTDLRRQLYEKIYLSGGTTMLPGIPERLINEIQLMKPLSDLKVRIFATKERRFSAWIGGSILASLPTFKKMWVDHKEYQEEGFTVLHRKTF